MSSLESDDEINEKKRRRQRILKTFSNFLGMKWLKHIMLSTVQPRIHVK